MSPLILDENKNFGGSLVLDFRKWWRHVKTIYRVLKSRFPAQFFPVNLSIPPCFTWKSRSHPLSKDVSALIINLCHLLDTLVSNGNRTEWSPIRSVIIRVITKSNDREAGVRFVNHEYDYSRIGRHEVLLPINHKKNTISEKRRIAKNKKRENLH